MKLFPKFALSISLVIGVAVAAFGLLSYTSEARNIRTQTELSQRRALQSLVQIAREAFLTNDDLLLVKYARWLKQAHPAMASASVVDPDGQVVADSEPTRIGHDEPDTAALADRVAVLSEGISIGNQFAGTASIAFSRRSVEADVQAKLRPLRRRLIGAASWCVLVGWGIAFLVAMSWTRPIAHLVRIVERLGQADWAIAWNGLEKRRDEIGLLSLTVHDMAAELQKLDEMKEDFVSAVTHELRSPLGAIESYLNLIALELRDGISISEWNDYLQRLRINTQRLTRFVNDLLDVAAIERGKIRLEVKPFDVVALAQDVIGLFSLKLQEKGLAYAVEADADSIWAAGDADKIRQVMMNLVANAIKFTPADGQIEIQIKPRTQAAVIGIAVVDNGIGIALPDQEKIFNKFEQVRSARQRIQGPKGTGLGLAISRALIELHGQRLRVESEIGRGSRFEFDLPAAARPVERSDV